MLISELRKPAYNGSQPRQQQVQGMLQHDQVGVVSHVTRGGPQVNDGRRARAALRERMHVRHDVMPHALFVLGCAREVDVVDRTFELGDLVVGDVEAQLLELREE